MGVGRRRRPIGDIISPNDTKVVCWIEAARSRKGARACVEMRKFGRQLEEAEHHNEGYGVDDNDG